MGQRVFKPKHKTVGTNNRTINLERDKRQRLYRGNETWRRFTVRFLEVNPTCYCCGEKAQAVDHIRPHLGDKMWFENTGNHMALCQKHHNTVTGKFDYKYVAGASVEQKVRWLNEERARNEIIAERKFPAVKVINYHE